MNVKITKRDKKKLVILGGGFAGATLALNLEKHLPTGWEIYLLSKINFLTFSPLLAEVIGASILPGHVQAPLRQMLTNTRIRMVQVDEVDFSSKLVRYHNEEKGVIAYDLLVFAVGVQANLMIIPGLKQHSLPLKTIGDAVHIRNALVERLEQATIQKNLKMRQVLTSFIVIGGGFSGVETAGELEGFIRAAEKFYRNVSRNDCRITIIQSSDRLLPELSESLAQKTQEIFEKRGIEVRLKTKVTEIGHDHVILSTGEVIKGATIICTIGTAPYHFMQGGQLPIERGRVRTRGDMSVEGFEGVWAIGDCALVRNAFDGRDCPPTAQFADRQAKQLARNLIAKINGRNTEDFFYKSAGMLASIGHRRAIAEIFGLQFHGFLTFLLWRGIYLSKVPTLAGKVRIFLEWSWALLFPPDVSHLGFKRSEDLKKS